MKYISMHLHIILCQYLFLFFPPFGKLFAFSSNLHDKYRLPRFLFLLIKLFLHLLIADLIVLEKENLAWPHRNRQLCNLDWLAQEPGIALCLQLPFFPFYHSFINRNSHFLLCDQFIGQKCFQCSVWENSRLNLIVSSNVV